MQYSNIRNNAATGRNHIPTIAIAIAQARTLTIRIWIAIGNNWRNEFRTCKAHRWLSTKENKMHSKGGQCNTVISHSYRKLMQIAIKVRQPTSGNRMHTHTHERTHTYTTWQLFLFKWLQNSVIDIFEIRYLKFDTRYHYCPSSLWLFIIPYH